MLAVACDGLLVLAAVGVQSGLTALRLIRVLLWLGWAFSFAEAGVPQVHLIVEKARLPQPAALLES